jgi:PPOX class probable F420-dependent enzyme
MAAASLAELPEWASDLLQRARVGHLSFLDERDRPRVLPVTYAIQDGAAWSAIDQKPKHKPPERLGRVRYLRRCPRAALGVDHYEDDWSRLAWVQLLGEIAILDVKDDPEALEALRAKYAPYVESPPEGPLLRLTIERALCWRALGD